MFLEVIADVLFWLFMFNCIVYFAAIIRMYRSVKGTHQRYVAATITIAAVISLMITTAARTVVYLLRADTLGYVSLFGAAMNGVFCIAYISLLKYLIESEDSWFNDQWKRLKRKFKRLKQRIAKISLSPTPLPSTA